jgi:hypothetical protein
MQIYTQCQTALFSSHDDSLWVGQSAYGILVEVKCSAAIQDQHWGLPKLLYSRYRASFLEEKTLGHGVDHPPPSNAKIKERVELYIYSFSGLSRPIVG